ncbi:E3 ubiquitin ligase Rnf157-like isoform X2 [Archocentrus centrarchus]|nr:E3 ubiquitin ligase Rnf157-like isoform X2 [Archocentrus centrarchus]
MSSMSGSYLAGAEGEPGGDEGGDVDCEENQDAPMENRRPSQQDRDFAKEPKEQNYSVAVEEQDSEGNDVTEEDCSSPSNGKGGRSRCPELANNNQGVALCDTPSLGLDNEQAPNSRFADEESCPVHIED